MFRKVCSIVLLTALSLTVALAQQPTSTTASPDRLRQVITYLASDALEGRRTGTPGATDAAHYIAGEFNRFGLLSGKPAIRAARGRGEPVERYMQAFPYVAGVELGKNNLFYVNPGRADDMAQFRVGADWMPLGFSSNGEVKNATVEFVGYGITDSNLHYEDYADVKGKIAVALAGTPDGDNPHGQFARFEQVRFKAVVARDHGATALLIISSEEKFSEDRLSRLRYDNNAGEAGLPVVVMSRKLAARVLGFGDLANLGTFETEVRDGISKRLKTEAKYYGYSWMKPNPNPVKPGSVNLSINVLRREVPANNVIGVLPGSDPKLKDEAIVLGAHYDHLGRGGEGSLAPREGEIHHGADDNASGVAGLIELARMLSSQNPKVRRTIVFIAFSGEEEGLIGSNYYVNHPVVPLASTVAMINMDMIGRQKEKDLIIGGVGTAQEWRSMIDSSNSMQATTLTLNAPRSEGLPSSHTMPIVVGANGSPVVTIDATKKFALTLNEDGYGPSDHSSFYAKQVPVLFFWTGTHNDYHKPSDTADKINYDGEARIVSLVANIVRDIDKSDKRPTYTVAKSESQGRSTGFRVYLGTIPNYADSNDGLKLDGVRDDSPASKAGLKAGDRIVKMAGHEVKNVYDYTFALGEMKAGQEYEVEIVRGSERLTLKITPAARK